MIRTHTELTNAVRQARTMQSDRAIRYTTGVGVAAIDTSIFAERPFIPCHQSARARWAARGVTGVFCVTEVQ